MENTPSNTIYSIYCITNLINCKKYIGFTSQNPPEKRFKNHCVPRKNRKLSYISKAIQKYSKENFRFEVILQGTDRDDVLSMETYFINEYNTLSPNGYNMTMGGEFGLLAPEIIEKMKGHTRQGGNKNSQYGKQKSETQKINISNSLKKYHISIGNIKAKNSRDNKIKKEKLHLEKIKTYQKHYKIYNNLGWLKFKEITNYPYTKQNFVINCKRWVPNFIPQNGKKRGINHKSES